MLKVFISYSRKDMNFAKKLIEALEGKSVECWIDVQDIKGGSKWNRAIQDGLDSSQTMIVIISPDSMSSKAVEDEWQYYLDENKKVIPILLYPTKIPFQLRRIQYIDFHEQAFPVAFSQLLVALEVDSGTISLTPAERTYQILQQSQGDWALFQRNDNQLLSSDTLHLIFENLTDTAMTPELLEYLLCSIAHRGRGKVKNLNIAQLKRWHTDFGPAAMLEIYNNLLEHPNATIRATVIKLAQDLEFSEITALIANALLHEQDLVAKRALLETAFFFKMELAAEVCEHLIQNNDDPVILTYALQNSPYGEHTILLMSDGTDFATELGEIASKPSNKVVQLYDPDFFSPVSDFQEIPSELLKVYKVIILVKGEHFSTFDIERFYARLYSYVSAGGKLLATCWVGWEIKNHPIIGLLLPFIYSSYHEDVQIRGKVKDEAISTSIFHHNIAYFASYEHISAKPDAEVLLEDEKGVPLFLYHRVGNGTVYYFNTCQHSCTMDIVSPLQTSSELKSSFINLFQWINSQS